MNSKYNYIKLTEKYFDLFNNYDLNNLEKIYDPNIQLSDWLGFWEGKKNVLQMNKELFQLSPKIRIIEINKAENYSKTFSKIEIEIGNENLKVMDVIFWNDGKIIKINAYKG